MGDLEKCPHDKKNSFMIRKTLLQTVRPGPGLKAPPPPEAAGSGHRASAVHAFGYQRNWAPKHKVKLV